MKAIKTITYKGKVYKPHTADDFYTKCNGCDLAKACNFGCIGEYNTFCDYWRKEVQKDKNNAYLQFKEVKED